MLPAPSAEAIAHSNALSAVIADEIASSGGSIPFERYMDLALYAPGLGYYSGPLTKFGEAGDFVTAPGIGNIFGRCVARSINPVLQALGGGEVIEFGAGDGALAESILTELAALERLPDRYTIVETSADLAARQRKRLDALDGVKIQWLDRLPESIHGVVIGNELIDAMPCHLFEIDESGQAMAVDVVLAEATAPTPVFTSRVSTRGLNGFRMPGGQRLPEGYRSELSIQGPAWLSSVGERLSSGMILLADYGFPAAEYYHPDRSQGTLMCHYRHHSHGDPFWWPGLQDITSHVDFSALARSARVTGLDLAGYTDQANFLIDCGLADILAASPCSPGSADALALSAEVKKLTMPHEMGELFKVIAFTSGLPITPPGFGRANRSARLLDD